MQALGASHISLGHQLVRVAGESFSMLNVELGACWLIASSL